jgi:hypothetical protein
VWIFFCNSLQWAWISSFTRFLDHTQRHTTLSRTPLDEWSSRRRDLYLSTLTTDKHPCPLRDPNPQSQQARPSRKTPQTARTLESSLSGNTHWKHRGYLDLTRSSTFSLTSALVGGVSDQRHGPAALPPRNDTLPTVREVVPRAGLKVCEKFCLTGIWPPDPPVCSKTLHRLSYSGRNWLINWRKSSTVGPSGRAV